jgi:peptidoglycan/LPS O-acetylase OafA/YrhL
VLYTSVLKGDHHYSSMERGVLVVAFLAVLIALSSVTYLLVERPMQNLGRRVSKWLDLRFGPDRAPAHVVRQASARDYAADRA